jgi:hypothetical protein
MFGIFQDGSIGIARLPDADLGDSNGPKIFVQREVLVQAAIALDVAGQSTLRMLSVAAGEPVSSPFGAKTRDMGTSIIGTGNQGGAYGLNGTLYDLVVFSPGLSEADNARVQGRLYWDYGLAHLLPDAHPYRVRPPAKS